MFSPRRTALSLAAASLTVLLAAGCSGAGSPPGSAGPTGSSRSTSSASRTATPSAADIAMVAGITVTGGSATTAPTVTFAATPISVSALTIRTLKEGTGDPATATSSVVVRQAIYRGSNGQKVDDNYADPTGSMTYLGDAQLITGLRSGWVGAKVGEERVIALPPAELWGSQGREDLGLSGTDDLVIVGTVEKVVLPAVIPNTITPAGAGLPVVAMDASAGPKVTIPSGTAAPASTVATVVTAGTGPVVTSGQTLVVNYVGVLWKDGSTFDSSWSRGAPAVFPIGQGGVIPAWDKNLVGQKVGSRVLLVVPPADGYGAQGNPPKISGTDTLVFVVDILMAG